MFYIVCVFVCPLSSRLILLLQKQLATTQQERDLVISKLSALEEDNSNLKIYYGQQCKFHALFEVFPSVYLQVTPVHIQYTCRLHLFIFSIPAGYTCSYSADPTCCTSACFIS